MRTVTNMYIANLAFADVIIGLFSIPFQVSGCKCCKMHFVNELVDSHIFMFSNYVNVEKRAPSLASTGCQNICIKRIAVITAVIWKSVRGLALIKHCAYAQCTAQTGRLALNKLSLLIFRLAVNTLCT